MVMVGKRVFVTVGTTRFQHLIETVSSDRILNTLIELGYTEVHIQVGDGGYIEKTYPSIKLKYKRYFENFSEEINKSDLVISHAGAGTCLEVLKLCKPIIVVINEDLMDNHQMELAEQLQNDCYLHYCTCNTLEDTLKKDKSALQVYPKPNTCLFSNYLNNIMGYAK